MIFQRQPLQPSCICRSRGHYTLLWRVGRGPRRLRPSPALLAPYPALRSDTARCPGSGHWHLWGRTSWHPSNLARLWPSPPPFVLFWLEHCQSHYSNYWHSGFLSYLCSWGLHCVLLGRGRGWWRRHWLHRHLRRHSRWWRIADKITYP